MPSPAKPTCPRAESGAPAVFASLLCCILLSTSSPAADTGQPYRLDIPSQPLGSALNSLALQTDTQILFEQAPVSGLQAPALSGEMRVEQAMNTLLAGTNLEAVRNPDGTLVVRSRPPAPPRAVRLTAARVEAQTPASEASIIRQVESPWSLRIRGVYRDFGNKSDSFPLAGIAGNGVRPRGLRAGDAWAGEFGAEYHFSPRHSAELAVSPGRSHQLAAQGIAPGSPFTYLDDLRVSAQFLTFKHNFLPESVLRPYLGVGISHIRLGGVASTLPALAGSNWEPVAQAGADLRLGRGWFLNADVRYARLRTRILPTASGSSARMKPDPLLLGIGFTYRFTQNVVTATPVLPAPAPVSAPAPVTAPIAVVPPPPPPAPADSDHDGVRDDRDQCPGTPPAFRVDSEGCEVEETVLAGVNFRTDSAILADGAQIALDPVVAALKLRPGANAEVHGYTDDRGPAAYNQKLSEQRAASVAEYLRRNGANEGQIVARGDGETQPIAGNDTEEGRARNRRVTIRFTRPLLK